MDERDDKRCILQQEYPFKEIYELTVHVIPTRETELIVRWDK